MNAWHVPAVSDNHGLVKVAHVDEAAVAFGTHTHEHFARPAGLRGRRSSDRAGRESGGYGRDRNDERAHVDT